MKFNNKKKQCSINFFSNEMFISEKYFAENHLKLTYQKQLISNLESKHKFWSKRIGY